MSKKTFTTKEVKQLSENPYVKSASTKGITYTDEFRQLFITSNQQGKLPMDIFESCGFEVQIVGMTRIKAAAKRWRARYREQGDLGLHDARGTVILKYNLRRMVSYLCGIAGVSKSGYYRYWTASSIHRRNQKEQADEEIRVHVSKAFDFKKRNKGARSIKMTLEGQFQIVWNLKRIRRIMKKYGIVCPHRKANPYKRMMKATQEHRVVPNLLQRNFKQGVPGKILLTDITYLSYGKGKRAYLSTIKDSSTNEILAYHVSERATMDLATNTLLHLQKNRRFKKTQDAFIHSDQGTHYTHPDFQKKVKRMGLGQSMSRRGNCWDNAPQESFFGHFNDEISLKNCTTLDEVKREIKAYMTYYNYYRYQWNLKRMTPVQYRDHLLQTV
ncbi:IS3 family transposase [Paenibacillus sp. FSL R10-2782]|uniref:IS3 family transposase n=1 Tax=Paenibacillus sp. FSL R10-2782 TaxID=2954661 RepID=UPI003159299F